MEILKCYPIARLSYKSTDFIFRNFPPVFACHAYLKKFFKLLKLHGTEAMLYRKQLSNYQGTIAPFTDCLFGFEKRMVLQ